MIKKIFTIAIILFFTANVGLCAKSSNAALRAGIQKYKAKNYAGCAVDMKRIVRDDPSNALAHYYAAISYARLGNKTEASNYYTKVITLDTDQTLKAYAQRGLAYLNDQAKYAGSNAEVEKFLDGHYKDGINPSVKKQIQTAELEQIRNKINEDLKAPKSKSLSAPAATEEKKDEAQADNKKSEMPTDDEIAQAVKTLAKAGINPINFNQVPYQSNDMAQLNMLLGNNNNNNNNMMMNFLPMMMQNNQNQSISKEFIQTMMMSQMMPSYSFDNNQNNY